MFWKKYILPVIIVTIIYTILFLFDTYPNYLNETFMITMLFYLLVRISDDVMDYQEDLAKGKNLFSDKVLKILFFIVTSLIITLIVIFHQYWFLLLLLINVIVLKYHKIKIVQFLKSLYIPLTLLFFGIYIFNFNYVYLILMLISWIIDLILIYNKEA